MCDLIYIFFYVVFVIIDVCTGDVNGNEKSSVMLLFFHLKINRNIEFQ